MRAFPKLGIMQASPARPRRKLITAVVISLVTLCAALYLTRETGVWGFYTSAGTDMHPTIRQGDFILTARFNGAIHSLEKGRIVIYAPGSSISGDASHWSIGRIVAKPGDTVSLRDGTIWINGVKYDAGSGPTKAPAKDAAMQVTFPVIVPANHVFILGDNPRHALDSRYFGPIRIGGIHQRVIYHPSNDPAAR